MSKSKIAVIGILIGTMMAVSSLFVTVHANNDNSRPRKRYGKANKPLLLILIDSIATFVWELREPQKKYHRQKH